MSQQELATKIRSTAELLNNTVKELENLLREGRNAGMEIELLDGINTEIAHELDGLTGFYIRIGKILAKTPL